MLFGENKSYEGGANKIQVEVERVASLEVQKFAWKKSDFSRTKEKKF